MGATNLIQFKGYNFYKITNGEKFQSSSFALREGDPLSLSYVVYSTANLTGANRTHIRFIGSNGLTKTYQSFLYSYTVGEYKEVSHEAIETPAGVVRGLIEWTSQAGETIWIGLPKAEHGTIATSFTNNYEGQLSRMTATGFYTGTITAERVVLASRTLGQELAIINSKQATFASDIGANRGNIATLSSRSLSLEATLSAHSERITKITAGEITLSDTTKGKVAGMTLSPYVMSFSSSSGFLQISTHPDHNYFFLAGSSVGNYNFLVNKQGKIRATDGTFSGAVTATSGSIGGYTIASGSLRYDKAGDTLIVLSGTETYPLSIQDRSGTGGYFRVDRKGNLTCNSVSITGNVAGTLTGNASSTYRGALNSATGSVSGLGGSLGGMGGWVSALGGSIGTSSSYMGGFFGGGAYGLVNSSSGYLGAVQYYGTSVFGVRGLFIGGSLLASALVSNQGVTTITAYASTFGRVNYTSLNKTSDERLKFKVTEPIQDFVKLVYELPIKDFEYKDSPGERHLGVIAQEINTEQPRWVSQRLVKQDDKGFFSIKYEDTYMAGLLALQDLNERVTALEKRATA